MSRERRIPKGKMINPTFFVFCEGETEEAYIGFLRSTYRLPILIDSKVAGNRITSRYISNYKNSKDVNPKDKTYLVYDLDVEGILGKLNAIRDCVLISSNPCFELWYLLHFQQQQAVITSNECESKLKKHFAPYCKGTLCNELKEKLIERKQKAIQRASKLISNENPSTLVYKLIEDLEAVKKG